MLLSLASGVGLGVLGAYLFFARRQHDQQALHEQQFQGQKAQFEQEFQQERDRRNRMVTLLAAMHRHVVSPTGRVPWKELAQSLVDCGHSLVDAEIVVLLLLNETTRALDGFVGRGISPEQLKKLHIQPGEGILGQVAQSNKVLITHHTTPSPAAALPQESFLTIPYVVVPVALQSRLLGVLTWSQPVRGIFGPEEVQWASLLAVQAAVIVENLKLYENLQGSYLDMVETLMRTLEARDVETHRHDARCRFLACSMAQELHLPMPLVKQIEYGALLHDLGKMGIPEPLLQKPAELTREEYEMIKKHCLIGYRILQPVSFLKPAAMIVLYHQEWFNGQGYPEGLAREEIPLGARIVGIIDAYDAMISDRSYRKALPRNAAIAELRRQSGTQFDPKLVDLFIRVLDRMEREGVALDKKEIHA